MVCLFAADLVSELLRNQLKIFVCAAPARAHPRRDWRTSAPGLAHNSTSGAAAARSLAR